MDQKLTNMSVWICFLTEFSKTERLIQTEICWQDLDAPLPTNPYEKFLKKNIAGMEIGHNPQENPQIYLAISTHLNNILIKVHQFSKIIGVKNKKRKPTITWTLDASCYSKHQWVGTCFGMTNSFGVGQKCLLFVVCLWVFLMEVCGVCKNDIFWGFFFGGVPNTRSMLDLVTQSSGIWKKNDPKHHLKWKLVIKKMPTTLW